MVSTYYQQRLYPFRPKTLDGNLKRHDSTVIEERRGEGWDESLRRGVNLQTQWEDALVPKTGYSSLPCPPETDFQDSTSKRVPGL